MEQKDPERLKVIKEKRIKAAKENEKSEQKLKQESTIMKNNIKRLDRKL